MARREAIITSGLPVLALSVRQPWAWAIIHGGKVIENRSLAAIRAGNMTPGTICIHAAAGMRQDEYHWGAWRLAKHGVACPSPANLPRGGIVGVVDVVEIVTQSTSEWFGGEAGLRLANPKPVEPIPAKGALGYFRWSASDKMAPTLPWMSRYGSPDNAESLFGVLPVQFEVEPPKPFRNARR